MSFLKNLLGGTKKMALTAGTTAPDFSLPAMTGEDFHLKERLSSGPVVLVFFKVSCPVCQFALPYIERIYKAQSHRNVTIVAVSQNNRAETARFAKEFGISYPILLEDTKAYPVSNAYGLTNVPTIFWIDQDETIEISSVGWLRKDIEEIHRKAAAAAGTNVGNLFQPNESVPEYRAG